MIRGPPPDGEPGNEQWNKHIFYQKEEKEIEEKVIIKVSNLI